LKERTIYLVDGTYNLFRAYHATPRLTTSKGMPTNAVYAFVQILRKLIADEEPRYLAVAFDTEAPTFRHESFGDYKAHREPMPEDLIEQMPWARKACEAMGIPILEMDGYEADDLIATIAQRAAEQGYHCAIVTSDKDLYQLVNDKISIINPAKGIVMNAKTVEDVFGVPPGQVIEVLALWGDPTDNIPGVPGIGEKGAKEIIRKYGTIENARDHAAEITRKAYREGLTAHFDDALKSRELATVRRDAPIDIALESLARNEGDPTATRSVFSELEFSTLVSEAPPAPKERKSDYETILTSAQLASAIETIRHDGTLALALEVDSPEPMRAHLVGLAMTGSSGRGWYIPFGHAYLGAPKQLPVNDTLKTLAPIIEDRKIPKVAHDIKREMILLRRHGIELNPVAFDPMVASYLIDPGRRAYTFEALAKDHLGLRTKPEAEVEGTGRAQIPLDQVAVESVTARAAERADVALRLRDALTPALKERELDELYHEMELPLIPVLATMEMTGVRVDPAVLKEMSKEFATECNRLESEIHDLAGFAFNINSPKQLGDVLFEKLELASKKRTMKTRALSTSQAVLEELAREHPLPRRVLEYRSLTKLKSTYIDALPLLINPDTGRVHTSYNQTVAATGRLSSSDPNLQNIPARTKLGRRIRAAFVPEKGWVFLAADYSQIELRVLAHMADVPELADAFAKGEDVHVRTAAEIFHVATDAVTSEMRNQAKTINFGVLYGMGPVRLADSLGIGRKEARAFIDRYFEGFPRVREYIDETIAQAERDGFVTTLFNRRRYFPEIRSAARMEREQALRAAVNTTLQGTAADLIKRAMLDLQKALQKGSFKSRMILQVHDELVLECPEDELACVEPVVKTAMEGVASLRAPLTVDIKTGGSWEKVT